MLEPTRTVGQEWPPTEMRLFLYYNHSLYCRDNEDNRIIASMTKMQMSNELYITINARNTIALWLLHRSQMSNSPCAFMSRDDSAVAAT